MNARSMLLIAPLTALLLGGCPPTGPFLVEGDAQVRVQTTAGEFVIRLFEDAAPETTANFLLYVNDDFYTGTIFHAVEPLYAVQAGSYLSDLTAKETREPVANESRNGLTNARATVGMGRGDDPNSATSQFYVNISTNPQLDPTLTTPGYTVFGYVVEGMDVIDAISELDTVSIDGFPTLPAEPVIIISATQEESGEEPNPEWEAYLAGIASNVESTAQSFVTDILMWFFTSGF